MKIGIYGYGNLGKGVECAIMQNPDTELVAVFTRRDPSTVKILTPTARVEKAENILSYKDEIDVRQNTFSGAGIKSAERQKLAEIAYKTVMEK